MNNYNKGLNDSPYTSELKLEVTVVEQEQPATAMATINAAQEGPDQATIDNMDSQIIDTIPEDTIQAVDYSGKKVTFENKSDDLERKEEPEQVNKISTENAQKRAYSKNVLPDDLKKKLAPKGWLNSTRNAKLCFVAAIIGVLIVVGIITGLTVRYFNYYKVDINQEIMLNEMHSISEKNCDVECQLEREQNKESIRYTPNPMSESQEKPIVEIEGDIPMPTVETEDEIESGDSIENERENDNKKIEGEPQEESLEPKQIEEIKAQKVTPPEGSIIIENLAEEKEFSEDVLMALETVYFKNLDLMVVKHASPEANRNLALRPNFIKFPIAPQDEYYSRFFLEWKQTKDSFYQGEINSENKLDGRGIKIINKGDIIIGHWKNDLQHGQLTTFGKDGVTVGEMKEGNKFGLWISFSVDNVTTYQQF